MLNLAMFEERIVVKIESSIKQKIAKLMNENNIIINSSNLGIIPHQYRYSQAINKIHGYLKNLRAHNLTAAINLYEVENQHIREARARAVADSFALSDIKRSVKETERAAQSAERLAVEAKRSIRRR